MDIIRWGILGPGKIAHPFAKGLALLPKAKLTAVGSRSLDRARKFGKEYNISHCHGSYEELADDPNVDVIYVATPHPMHKDNSIMCLEAGKAVLCEKPFTINSDEAEEVINCSIQNKIFIMDAMWIYFLPLYKKVRQVISEGKIGEPRMLTADFGFRAEWDVKSRIFNPELGGGALLDVGVYPVYLTSMIFNEFPINIQGAAHLGETGVDEQSGIVLHYDTGQIAVLSCAVRTRTPSEARIDGTEGSIYIHPPCWRATKATIRVNGEDKEALEAEIEGTGYQYEAAHVMQCLRFGVIESPVIPHLKTFDVMKIMDKLRKQWGLKYPVEE